MKIGVAQINTTVGDLAGNRSLIIEAYRDFVERGVDLVTFPELAVCGYPPRDLLFKSRFVRDSLQSLQDIAAVTGETPLLVGYPEFNDMGRGRPFLNAAAWCMKGKVVQKVFKTLLPTYDVFDEDRYFEPSKQSGIVHWKGKKLGVTICEDIWVGPDIDTGRHYQKEPLSELESSDLDLLLNISASPWHFEKGEIRDRLIRRASERCRCPVVYCNAVGGNDELIFDGQSVVINPRGEKIAALPAFESALEIIDLDSPSPSKATAPLSGMESIFRALVLGLRDYAMKSGFHQAIIGLSGGIDSSVTAVIATEALGKENILGISNPSSISSQHSQDDSARLAANLGVEFIKLPIHDLVRSAETILHPLFKGTQPGIAEENIQARARGLLWMAISNKFGRLLLTCGNKSELAVGYCTLYGDMCGGLAVISDVPKTKVYDLARWLNREKAVIPESIITKPPSAELRPGQKDEDSLPPYPVLDAILHLYVEKGKSSAEMIEQGYEPETVRSVIRKVDLNEYKRKQAAPGLKITPLAFGVGRRIPIVQKYVS